MTPESTQRLAEIALLESVLEGSPTLMTYLRGRRAELTEKLVSAESENTRGRIHEIDELLGLSERLRREAIALAAPQQEAELP